MIIISGKKPTHIHLVDIKSFASVIEDRLDDSWCTKEMVLADNAHNYEMCKKHDCNYILIDDKYQVEIELNGE